MDTAEHCDMVIVGAGFHGLAMARTYLSVNPDASLIILEAGTSIGGVWARDRLYPHLKTNSVMGYFEFSDFPMTPEIYGVELGKHIPGDVVRRYLEDFANHYDLARRCRFNQKLEEAEDLQEDGWLLKIAAGPEGSDTKETCFIHASKMTVCIGVTSEPKLPSFPGQDKYTGSLFHSRDFGPKKHLLDPQKTRSVAVFAGNKSAYDVVWAFANAGVKVQWILRESGHGACWMGPTRMTPFKVLAESLIMTRMVTWLFPCIWGDADGWDGPRNFLQRTERGRAFVKWFAKNVMQHTLEKNTRFEEHEEIEKLRPWYDLWWVATGRGLLNYDSDVYEFIRKGMVNIHVADVDELGDREIHLSNGTSLENIDAMVCCSGWKHGPTMKFTRNGIDIGAELGLPHILSAKENELYKPMVAEADAQIKSKLPCLTSQPEAAAPPHLRHQQPRDPIDPASGTLDHAYLLHRFMAPPSRITANRTLAFSGATRTPITALLAQIQALWITAFFEHRIASLEPSSTSAADEVRAHATFETILHARYGRWRYPHGFGAVMADLFFDSLPLLDLMVRDLGLPTARKGGSFLREVAGHYGAAEYSGIVDEWMAEQARRDREAVRKVLGGEAEPELSEESEEEEEGEFGGGKRRYEASPQQKRAVQRAMVGVGLVMGGLTLSLGIGVAVALM
ncbi:hypothetical protein HDK64DRAFT_234729 [Phyllosticta capitalensis]